jgi:hypothetical protein
MHRIVNTLALTALVITLGAGLWQDWGVFTTMKRMILSYLGFFLLGGMLTLAVLSVPLFEEKPSESAENQKERKKKAA